MITLHKQQRAVMVAHTYSSSLKSVAMVDSDTGAVTMVGVGDTVITATEAATVNYEQQVVLYNLKVTTGS
ncbi:hypothetical protein ACPSKX_13350 [Moritella viscosa]